LPHSAVVWVTVAEVQHSRARWTYTLTEDQPASLNDRTRRDRPIPTEKLCHSYTELFLWLNRYGCVPPPPDYFAPSYEEIDEGVDSIVRGVMRPH